MTPSSNAGKKRASGPESAGLNPGMYGLNSISCQPFADDFPRGGVEVDLDGGKQNLDGEDHRQGRQDDRACWCGDAKLCVLNPLGDDEDETRKKQRNPRQQ